MWIYAQNIPSKGQNFGRFNRQDCYTSLQKNVHIVKRSFHESESFRLTQRYFTTNTISNLQYKSFKNINNK